MTSKERDLIHIIGHLLDAIKDLQVSCSSLSEMVSERLPDLTPSERETLKNASMKFVALSKESGWSSDFFHLLVGSPAGLSEELERR